MFKRLCWCIAALVAIALMFQLAVIVASESGEVVVLTTRAADGSEHDTRLWLAELDDRQWVRSGSPASAWFKRLQARPQVLLTRDGIRSDAQASPDRPARDTVNALMRDKYGWADRWISLVFGRDDAIPVRISPLPAP